MFIKREVVLKNYTMRVVGREPRIRLDEFSVHVVDWLSENCQLTLNELQTKLFDQFGVIVSTSTIDRHTKAARISVKKAVPVPAPRHSLEVRLERIEYAHWMTHVGLYQPRYYQDEFGVSLWSRRSIGRAPIGQRAYVRHPTASPGNGSA